MNTVARLDFGNGYLGLERCVGDDGKQFLRAFIYIKSIGSHASAGVELPDVADFLFEAMKQMAFAHLNADKDDAIVEAALIQMVDDIRAEQASEPSR